MRSLDLFLSRHYLPRILARVPEGLIPRSGEKGSQVNCFAVYILKNEKPYLMPEKIRGDELECTEWDGEKFNQSTTISLKQIAPLTLQITHFYGLDEIVYDGIISFVLNRIFGFNYIKIHIERLFEKINQHFFNKKKLVAKQRIDLLRLILSKSLEGAESVNAIDLMTDIYTIRWVFHPGKKEGINKVKLYLESLADTGELKRIDYKYSLTGKAFQAIEEYEEQERKHSENVNTQKTMLWVTLLIALLTLAQAGLVKLPTLIDLSTGHTSATVENTVK